MSSVWCAGTVFSSSYAAAVGPPSHAALMFDTTHAAAVVNTIARLWFLLLSSSSSSFSEALCCFDDFFFAAVVIVVVGVVLLFVVVGRDHPLTFRFVVGTKTIDDDDVVVVVARCHIPITAFLNGASFSSFRFFPIEEEEEEEEEEILQSSSHRAYIYLRRRRLRRIRVSFLHRTTTTTTTVVRARATTTTKWSSSKSHQKIVMAKHHPDLIMCRKMPGIAIGRLCEKCDGKCVVCDSYVRPATLVRVCDECNYGSNQGRCVICNAVGVSDAYYCQGCVMQEKDRDGCPKIINLGSAKTDLFYHKKAAGEITGSGGRTY